MYENETVVRKLRIDRRIRQEHLASLLGISQEMLSRYERNKLPVPVTKRVRYARFFGCDLNELFHESGMARLAL